MATFAPAYDRITTISYAIDLLKAHQIRRENAFLQGELKSAIAQVAVLRTEVKDLKVGAQPSKVEYEQLSSSMKKYDAQMKQFLEDIPALNQSRQDLQTALATLQDISSQVQEEQQKLEKWAAQELHILKLSLQNLVVSNKQQTEVVNASIDSLSVALSSKADLSAVEPLRDQVKSFENRLPDRHWLESVSRVNDSIDQRAPHVCGKGATNIQVHDSQLPPIDPEDAELLESLRAEAEPAREASIPDDIDLDEHAGTISYAGHYYPPPEEPDSFRMLPQQGTKTACDLASINTLYQEQTESWDDFLARAMNRVKSLPKSFDPAAIRRAVDGLVNEADKTQCKSWLNMKGWTWENVVLYISRKRVPTGPRQHGEPPANPGEIPTDALKRMEAVERSETIIDRDADVPLVNRAIAPRRSQRLIKRAEAGKSQIVPPNQGRGPHPEPKRATKNLHDRTENLLRGKRAGAVKLGGLARDESSGLQHRTGSDIPHISSPSSPLNGSPCPVRQHTLHGRSEHNPDGLEARTIEQTANVSEVLERTKMTPQLVPRKRPLRPSEESSVEVDLPPMQTPTVEQPLRERKRHRRHTLKLPPPPEIPILPTTDE